VAGRGLKRRLIEQPLAVLGSTAFLLQFCDVFLVTTAFTLFMRRSGVASLPQAYVVLNLMSIALQIVVLSRPNVSTFRLARQLTMGLLVVLGVGIPFVADASAVFYFGLFLFVRMHDLLALGYFITYAQSVFPVRAAKANIGRLLGISSLATVVGGLSVKPLVARFSFPVLFGAGAVLILVLLAMMALCEHLWPPSTGTTEASGGGLERVRDAFGVVRGSSLAGNIIVVWFLFTFLRCLIDFQFSKTSVMLYPSDAELAGFIGSFQAGLAILNAVAQFTVAGRLMQTFKMGGTMCLSPIMQLVGCIAIVIHPWPWLVIGLQALWTIGFHVTVRPCFNVLMVPLESATRERVGILSSMAAAAGSLVSGLVLLGCQDRLPVQWYFLFVGLCYVYFVVLTRRLDRDYLATVDARISSADAGARVEALAALGHLGAGRDREYLVGLLEDVDPRVRMEAVRRLNILPPAEAEPLVRSLLDREPDVRVQATVARVLPDILGERTLPVLRSLLESNDDARVRANAIEALGMLGAAEDASLVRSSLRHPSNRVKANAVVALLRVGRTNHDLREALAELAAMMRDDAVMTRAAAASAPGQLRYPCFAASLFAALDDEAVEVRRNAIRSLSRLRHAEALARLRRIAVDDESDEIRQAASRACRLIEDQKMNALGRLAGRLSAAQRGRIAGFLQNTGGGPKTEILEALLRVDWPEFPEALLVLARMTDDDDVLRAVRACLQATPIALDPLLAFLDGRFQGEHPQGIRFLETLGRLVPDDVIHRSLEPYLQTVLLLHLAAEDERFAQARAGAVEHLILWSAVLGRKADGDDIDEEQEALTKALEGALSSDAHLASLSLESLESRLRSPVFTLLAPYLEALARDQGPVELARRLFVEWDGPPPIIRSVLRVRLPEEALSPLWDAAAARLRGRA